MTVALQAFTICSLPPGVLIFHSFICSPSWSWIVVFKAALEVLERHAALDHIAQGRTLIRFQFTEIRLARTVCGSS